MKFIAIVLKDWLRDLFVNGFINSRAIPRYARWVFLRAIGYDISRSVLAAGLHIGGNTLTIGRGSFLNYQAFLDTSAPITIGERVRIGMRVTIITGSHEYGDESMRAGATTAQPVTIGDGCWIGAGVTVLPGVTIGSGCVIAAGALVTADCPPNGEYVGVPARRRRELAEPEVIAA